MSKTIELTEVLNEWELDEMATDCLSEASISEDDEQYDDMLDAVKWALTSISFEVPDTREEIEELL